jgi:hypothetical protein
MARVFNGTSDRIDANTARLFNKATAASASMWAFAASPSSAGQCYAEGNTGSNNNTFTVGTGVSSTANVRLLIKINNSGSDVDATGTAAAFEAHWHHILFTQDTSNNCIVYVDGQVDISTSYSSAQTYSANDLVIGALRRASISNWFAGSIAEVANWSRTLSAAEALQLALGVPASQLVPDHYWPLAGVASPEPDIGTATTVNGTLNGTTSAAGPPIVGLSSFIPSLGRRPVPMIKGPDKDTLLSMRGNSF